MGFNEENFEERLKFVDLWAEYVRNNSDKDWSKQQNFLINSFLKTCSMSKEDFLRMKEEVF